jgi:hypothetical protein
MMIAAAIGPVLVGKIEDAFPVLANSNQLPLANQSSIATKEVMPIIVLDLRVAKAVAAAAVASSAKTPNNPIKRYVANI